MKLISFVIVALLLTIWIDLSAQTKKCKKSFSVMHYNVENLFDTIDDPHKNDNEFLPTSKKNWNSARYNQKIKNLAKVIAHTQDKSSPDIVALVEIENSAVLNDLTHDSQIESMNYQVVHHEGPDERSIDCALLYNPKNFKLLLTRAFPVKMESNSNFKTRDILYVKGWVLKKDTLHVFVNHWPSRLGGVEKSEPKRVAAAQILRSKVDSILALNPSSKILIVGDFNDETSNKSIKDILKAGISLPIKDDSLYNMAGMDDLDTLGSYYYYGDKQWNMIDQMIISKGLTQGKGMVLSSQRMLIIRHEWMLKESKNKVKSPFKTYEKEYTGGYSDHLPIYHNFGFNCR